MEEEEELTLFHEEEKRREGPMGRLPRKLGKGANK